MIPLYLQVCTPDQAKQFKQLGIKQTACFWHFYSKFYGTFSVKTFKDLKTELKKPEHLHLAAYSAPELYIMLPDEHDICKEPEPGMPHHLFAQHMAAEILECIDDKEPGFTVSEINQRISAVRKALTK